MIRWQFLKELSMQKDNILCHKCYKLNILIVQSHNSYIHWTKTFHWCINIEDWFPVTQNCLCSVNHKRLHCSVSDQGVVSLTFCELSKINFTKIHNTGDHIYGENFKLKLCMCAQCPKHGFGHTYKVSAWNSHENYDFCNTQISKEYLGELAKRQWNNPQISFSLVSYQGSPIANTMVDWWEFHFINSSSPGQNGRHFADDIFRCIFVNEKLNLE